MRTTGARKWCNILIKQESLPSKRGMSIVQRANTTDTPATEAEDRDALRHKLTTVGNSLPIVARAALSTTSMLALAVIVYRLNIPNPNMILVTGLTVFATIFGYAGSIPSALVMTGYTALFFSTDHDFVSFTDENVQKLLVTALGVLTITLFVSRLKRAEDKAFNELSFLNAVLQEDNRLLAEASAIDGLTGLRNRLALRQDYDLYNGLDLCVMMMDVDDFKTINDTLGHAAGDTVLTQVSEALTTQYGSGTSSWWCDPT